MNLETFILKKLRKKPMTADDLAYFAPGEALPADIDRALRNLKQRKKIQVTDDDEWELAEDSLPALTATLRQLVQVEASDYLPVGEPASVIQKVRHILSSGKSMRFSEIKAQLKGGGGDWVARALGKLVDNGEVERVEKGVYKAKKLKKA